MRASRDLLPLSRRGPHMRLPKPSLIRRSSGHRFELEVRTAPALFVVTSLSDGPVAAPGDQPGTLRQAVFDANNEVSHPGEDTITFAANVSGTIILIASMQLTSNIKLNGPGPGKLTLDVGQQDDLLDLGGS